MLSVKNLSKSFSIGGNQSFKALDNIDLTLENESFNILIGGNGSGKSTLLNLIAGTIFPETGDILIGGKSIVKKPDYNRAAVIARIFQDPGAGTAPDLTVLENFRMAALRKKSKGLRLGLGKAFQDEVAERLSSLSMGLENKLYTQAHQLSGGQRQAMALLMATFDPPEILLLDEPTAALDPKSATKIMQLADQIIREKSITALLVTHHMKEAVDYGDRLIQLHHGRIRRDLDRGEKSVLKPSEIMEWFYEE